MRIKKLHYFSYLSIKTTEATAKEKIQAEVAGSIGTDGNVSIDELNKNLQNINGIKYNNYLYENLKYLPLQD